MPYQDDLRRYFGEIARYAEPALTAGSAMVAEPVSGLAGLGALLSGRGINAAADSINAAQQAMTYQPRTMEGQQGLQGLQAFLQPVGEAIQGASQNLGDKAFAATGSPALAAAAYSAPTAFLEGFGLKGLNIARRPVSGADLYTPRSFGGNIQNFRAPDFELDPSELADVGADVSDGFVTLYHRTTPENAEAIRNSGKFSTKEDGVFFSTALEGQAKDYGAGVVKVKVPVSMLQLDDIFDGEAHVRVPMKKAGSIDLSSFILKDEKPATGAGALGDDSINQLLSAVYSGRKSFFDDSGNFDYGAYRNALYDAEDAIDADTFNAWQNSDWQAAAQGIISDADKEKVVNQVKSKTLYHGSPYEFDDLDVPDDGGAFLTGSIDSAKHYADGGNVYEYKIQPKKPFFASSTDSTYDIEQSGELTKLKKQGYDSIIPLDGGDYVVLDKAILKRVK